MLVVWGNIVIMKEPDLGILMDFQKFRPKYEKVFLFFWNVVGIYVCLTISKGSTDFIHICH
jgi:hypothetical protein